MPGQNGGARKGAGRKPSALTVRTREIAERAISSGDTTPLEYMLRIMRDPTEPPMLRFEAARSAAPYMHPRLNAVEHTGSLAVTHEQALAELAAGPADDQPSEG